MSPFIYAPPNAPNGMLWGLSSLDNFRIADNPSTIRRVKRKVPDGVHESEVLALLTGYLLDRHRYIARSRTVSHGY